MFSNIHVFLKGSQGAGGQVTLQSQKKENRRCIMEK